MTTKKTNGTSIRMSGRLSARQLARGFSLVSAIFLLVVLGGLGAAMVQLSSMQHTSSALDLQGSRAYQAARTGLEWGLYQRINNGDPYCNPGPTTNTFTLPAGSALAGFTVTVTCTLTTTGTLNRWQITSVACNQPVGVAPACPNANGDANYVERQMQVDF